MSSKMLIIILAVVVLLMGIMGAGFFLMWNKMSAAVAQVQTAAEPAEEEKTVEEDTFGPLFKLDTMIVNLADKGGKRYLRVTMELELSSPETVAEIEKRMAMIRDGILMILPSKTYAEISTTEGKIALRNQIMAKINEMLSTGSVKNIYFTEFVVQ